MIAGSHFLNGAESMPLLAKQGAIQTESVIAKADVEQYQVVTVAAAASGDGLEASPFATGDANGVACFAAKAGEHVTVYTQGSFNHEALKWPAAADTIGKRKVAFAKCPTITVEELHA